MIFPSWKYIGIEFPPATWTLFKRELKYAMSKKMKYRFRPSSRIHIWFGYASGQRLLGKGQSLIKFCSAVSYDFSTYSFPLGNTVIGQRAEERREDKNNCERGYFFKVGQNSDLLGFYKMKSSENGFSKAVTCSYNDSSMTQSVDGYYIKLKFLKAALYFLIIQKK